MGVMMTLIVESGIICLLFYFQIIWCMSWNKFYDYNTCYNWSVGEGGMLWWRRTVDVHKHVNVVGPMFELLPKEWRALKSTAAVLWLLNKCLLFGVASGISIVAAWYHLSFDFDLLWACGHWIETLPQMQERVCMRERAVMVQLCKRLYDFNILTYYSRTVSFISDHLMHSFSS